LNIKTQINADKKHTYPLDRQRLTQIKTKVRFFFHLSFYLLVIATFIFCVAPFFWLLVTSLKSNDRIYSLPISYLPLKPSLDAYKNIIFNRLFLRYILNSLVVAILTTAVCLCFAALASYSIARLRIRYKGILELCLLIASIFPQIIFLVPLYELISKLRLMNNPLGLLLPYVAFSLPLAIWILVGFFKTIPKEIEEQAMVDGFSRLDILRKIILPLSWPALATTAILIFIGPFAWNEFLFSLSFMIKDTSRTVPVGIALLSGTSMYEIPWNRICAACVLTTLPLVIFVFLFQRRIISGLTRGAVKG
jgi:ABC-type glycerol-3-phosphate transport system permease component